MGMSEGYRRCHRQSSLSAPRQKFCNSGRFKVGIALALRQNLQGCPLVFREISPFQFRAKIGYSPSHHLT